jgi:hypothetical protein
MSSYVSQDPLIDTSYRTFLTDLRTRTNGGCNSQQQDKISSKDVKPSHHHTPLKKMGIDC